MKRFAKVLLCTLLILCTVVSSGLAASKTYKGQGSTTYTIETGSKGAKLTISGKKGTYACMQRKNSNHNKTSVASTNIYGSFSVSVSGFSEKTIESGKLTYQLQPNSTYTVTVRYKGASVTRLSMRTKLGYSLYGDYFWKKDPGVSISVNNWAKIY